jgi:ubiquinone/menaquinone biosynthesis C-methylase UbiE
MMGREIDLLVDYPKAKRNLEERAAGKTEEQRAIARQFGREFFDGDRSTGYGGFSYAPRIWQPVMPTFIRHWALTSNSSVLDVGCAKGFMLFDLVQAVPGISVAGVDVAKYAIENCMPEVAGYLQVADARDLPYPDDSFDVVISINTVHNLDRDECGRALAEIQRVSRGGAFITVDAYRDAVERQRMMDWNLTAKTIMSTTEWVEFFDEVGYTGDYYWFIP